MTPDGKAGPDGIPVAVVRPAVRHLAGLPLWQQVQADLRARVNAGEFAAQFPGEHALTEQYGVSRHTVREALRGLRAEGLVIAARGRQPRLADPAPLTQLLGAASSLFSSVEQGGARQASVVRRLEVLRDGTVAARLGLEESSPLVHLERLRLAGAEPLALDRAWLPLELAEPLLDADFTHTALYDVLAARCGVRPTGSTEQVRAVVPNGHERRLLELDSRTALLAIDRIACYRGRPIEWRRTLIRGDRFALTASFPSPTRPTDAPDRPAVDAGPPSRYQLRSQP